MKTLLNVILFLIVIDIIGSFMWAVSGQTPQQEAYIGIMTTKLITSFR